MKRFSRAATLLFGLVIVPRVALAAADVVASIAPVHSLVAGVMAGVGEPHLIVPPGASPHTYSMRPSDARALQAADAVFWMGEGVESFLARPIANLAIRATVVELADVEGVALLPLREGGAFEADDHHGHRHGAGEEHDTHVWLDPMNARAMVGAIAETLTGVDPDNGATYAANAERMETRLDTLTRRIDAELEPVRGRPYVVFHDAYQYFERRFGVPATGSLTVNPGIRPGAGRLAAIRLRIRDTGAECVFAEPEFDARRVAVAVDATGAHTAVLDPLGSRFEPGPDLYFETLAGIADALRTCLSGR